MGGSFWRRVLLRRLFLLLHLRVVNLRHLILISGYLRRLNLRDNQIGSMNVGGRSVGIGKLASGDNLPGLRWLDVRGNGIGDGDQKALRQRFGEKVRC